MRPAQYLLASTLALTLASACSQEAETPANQQNAVDAGAMATDPSNPYAQAEMQMMEQMATAQGANPAETWARKMIEHHRGAIAMTGILEAQGGDPQVLEKARMTAEKQRREITELENLLAAGGNESSPSDQNNPYAAVVQQMHQRMMVATGADPSETWMRKMIEHHRGGVAMSNVLFELGGDPQILEKARMTARDQAREAEELERMLQGGEATAQPTAAVQPASEPSSSRPEQVAPASAPKEKDAPAPEAETKEAPAVDPHAGHDMGNMANMSH